MTLLKYDIDWIRRYLSKDAFMTPLKRNLSRFFIFFLVLVLSATIFGFVYFFKMERSEDTLNTLYFRELQQIESGIQRSIEKVSKTGSYSLSLLEAELKGTNSEIKDKILKQANTNFEYLANSAQELSSIKLLTLTVDDEYCKSKHDTLSLRIAKFNTVEFTKKVCLKERHHASLTLSASIDKVLSQRVNRFQTVALVENEGVVRSIVNNRAMLTNEPELYFKTISSKLASSNSAKSNENVSLFGTHFEDITLDRNKYRVYVHPIVSKGLSADNREYFLVGLVNKQVIVTEKLKLPSEVLMWLILALLLFIACTPLLKLRFVSATYAIQKGDKSQIILGLLIAVGILSIGISQQLFQGYLVSVKEGQLENIHKSMTNDVRSELTRIIEASHDGRAVSEGTSKKDINSELDDDTASTITNSEPEHSSKPYIIDSGWEDNLVNIKPAKQRTFLETAIYLDCKANIKPTERGKKPRYASNKLVLKADTNLSHREYFKRGMQDDFWTFGDTKLYLQRIFNIEDGRLNSVIVYPVSNVIETKSTDENAENQQENRAVLKVAGARISSLVDRVLPKNFGFAVIDSEGDVVFHSTDSLSLVENFYTEINQDPLPIIANNHRRDEVIQLDADYKGVPHKMAVGPLFGVGKNSTIPWNLIVFFDPSEMHTNNMILVFVAVLLFLLLIIPSFLVCRYLVVQKFWQDICYFDRQIDTRFYILFSAIAVSMAVYVVFQMGLIHSLLARLSLWGLACIMLMFIICYLLKLSYSVFFFWHRPKVIIPALLMPILLLTVFFDWRTNYDIVRLNIASAIWGAIALLGVFTFLLYRLILWRSVGTENHLFSPKVDNPSKKIEIRQRDRFSIYYPIFLTSIVFLAAATPASIITYSAHEYLLERQANFDEDFLRHNFRVKTDSLQQYVRFISEKKYLEVVPTFPKDYGSLTTSFVLEHGNEEEEKNSVLAEHDITKPALIQWSWFSFNSQHSSSTDKLFDLLFDSTFDGTDFVSHLTYEAKLTLSQKNNRSDALHYRTDYFMISAIFDSDNKGVILCMILFLLALYVAVRQLIIRRLMGEHLHDQYRMRAILSGDKYYATNFPDLTKLDDVSNRRSQLILNTTRASAEVALNKIAKNEEITLYQQQVFRIMDCLDKFYSSEEHLETFFFIKKLKLFLASNKNKRVIVAISALEQISLDISMRKDALALLYEIHNDPKIRLVIVAETAPLYRLLTPKAYQPSSKISVDIDEKTGWTKLFSEFDKHYAWSPVCKKRLDNPFDPNALFNHELHAWPEMKPLRDHCSFKLLREPEQVIEYMLVHAGPIYRRKWEECTVNEKVILWRIANGATINPESTTTIERLMRRCYLYRDKGWYLINESFRQFILTAEPESTMKEWLDNTDVGVWSVLRVPVFALLLVLVAVFVYSSGSSLDTFLGVATATLGLIPLLIKNISLIRGGSTTDIE